MVVKKVSWRRSKKALSLLFSPFLSLFSKNNSYYFLVMALVISGKVYGMEDKIWLTPNSNDKTEINEIPSLKHEWDPEEIAEMSVVFDTAPERAKAIPEHLADDTFFSSPRYRMAFFEGEPGTGKTVMAKAIAWKSDREPYVIEPYVVRSGTRGETSICLREMLKVLTLSKDKKVIIFDEADTLFENPHNESNDSKETATAFWQWLDANSTNKNLFVIATSNNMKSLPQPLKSRALLKTIHFTPIIDPVKKREAFMRYLVNSPVVRIDDALESPCIEQLFIENPEVTPREFAAIADYAREMARLSDCTSKGLLIKQTHIEKGFRELAQDKVTCNYTIIPKSDREINQEHHEENLNQQQNLHQDNQQMHIASTVLNNPSLIDGVFRLVDGLLNRGN